METRIQEEDHPWSDWEDHGGFDDEDALMGRIDQRRHIPFPELPWYYEKKQCVLCRPVTVGIQMSFL